MNFLAAVLSAGRLAWTVDVSQDSTDLVGCGTISGYLTDLLVRAGAGTGIGELVLIDNQNLAPRNLGRHCLGINRLEKNKAQGVQAELKTTMPSANVMAFPQDAFHSISLDSISS